jgi:SAM-dependent methyltransferase
VAIRFVLVCDPETSWVWILAVWLIAATVLSLDRAIEKGLDMERAEQWKFDYWRSKYLLPALTTDKSIALIGIGDAYRYQELSEKEMMQEWDAYRVSKNAKTYAVYDINDNFVKICRKFLINAHTRDIAQNKLPQQYDYIFAGDVIEHVENPTKFMINIRDSLAYHGIMILTTPNALYWRNFLYIDECYEHNFVFNKKHFENLSRKLNLKILEISSFQTTSSCDSVPRRLLNHFHNIMAKCGFGNSIIFVAKRLNDIDGTK